MKAELRIKSVGTKVTETEYGRLDAAAKATGQTLAEWAREVLLAAVTETHTTPAEETVLAEVLGLRTILLNLFYKLAKGEAISEEEHQLADVPKRAGGELSGGRGGFADLSGGQHHNLRLKCQLCSERCFGGRRARPERHPEPKLQFAPATLNHPRTGSRRVRSAGFGL